MACSSNTSVSVQDAGNDVMETSANSDYTGPISTAPSEINPGYPPNGNGGSDFGSGTGCTLNNPCKPPSKM